MSPQRVSNGWNGRPGGEIRSWQGNMRLRVRREMGSVDTKKTKRQKGMKRNKCPAKRKGKQGIAEAPGRQSGGLAVFFFLSSFTMYLRHSLCQHYEWSTNVFECRFFGWKESFACCDGPKKESRASSKILHAPFGPLLVELCSLLSVYCDTFPRYKQIS